MEHFSDTSECTLRPRLVYLQQQFTSGQEHAFEANQPVNPSNHFLDCIMKCPCITGKEYFEGQNKPMTVLWHCTQHAGNDNGLRLTGLGELDQKQAPEMNLMWFILSPN